MAALGMRAIIVEGNARGYHYVLKFSKNSVEFLSGENLAGLNNYEIADRLERVHGDGCSFIMSGPMTQKGAPTATISATDAAGNPDVQYNSGFGLLMGGLGVAAIVFDESECGGPAEISSEKRPEYEKLVSEFNDAVLKDRTISEMLSPYGTASFIMPLYECGALPLSRYEKFESANISKLSHQTLGDIIQKRKGSCGVSCTDGCLVKCKNIFIDDKNIKTPYIEYEHIAQLGSMSEIFNFDVIARVLRYCREKGLDFSEIALAIGETIGSGTQKGTPAEIAVACLSEIDKQTVLGKIILKGAYASAISIGDGCAVSVSGEAMPPFDPRAVMGLGVSYITSPVGIEEKGQGYIAAAGVSKAGGYVTGNQPEGQVEFSRNMQLAFHVIDTLGLCPNLMYPLMENQELWNCLVKIISLRYNVKLTFQEAARLAKKLIKEENAFNRSSGRENIRTKLPSFFYNDVNEKTQSVFSVNDEAIEKIFEAW
jgi:aldehyde:ferredoxin oxidoreductase